MDVKVQKVAPPKAHLVHAPPVALSNQGFQLGTEYKPIAPGPRLGLANATPTECLLVPVNGPLDDLEDESRERLDRLFDESVEATLCMDRLQPTENV